MNKTLSNITGRNNGVRWDMDTLDMNPLFERSWSNRQMSGDAGIEEVKMILIPGTVSS